MLRGALRILLVALMCVALESPARAQEAPPASEEAQVTEGAAPVADEEPVEPSTDFDPLFSEDLGELEELDGFPDPLETMNRPILRFNQELDRWVLDPLTRAYRFVVPGFARRAIRRVLLNIDSPPVIANDLLQLEFKDAGVTLLRLLVNSTFGIGGLIEAAETLGLEPHQSDFGQTLALAETPSGPFLILPVLGPSNARDGFGQIVDAFLRPTTYVFPFLSPQQLFFPGTLGITLRESQIDALKALEKGSVDYYAALRNAVYQNRQAHIWGRREHRREDWRPPEVADD